MVVAATRTQYTIEEFLALPDHRNYELVDGELEEIKVSNLSVWVAGRVFTRLEAHCEKSGVGEAFGADAYYECFPDRPKHARKPDVSFIRAERLPPGWLADGYFTIWPDLAVEVISPGDSAYKVDEKIREFLEAGVRLVWQINPEERIILIHRPDVTVTKLNDTGTLSGEDVVPGFLCSVAELFPPKPAKV